MSELCNCIFFSLSPGGRKEEQIRPRLNEAAQSCSAAEAKSKQIALIISCRSSLTAAAALCVMCSFPLHYPSAASAFNPTPACSWPQWQPSLQVHLRPASAPVPAQPHTAGDTGIALEVFHSGAASPEPPPSRSRKCSYITIPIQTCWGCLSCQSPIFTPSWDILPLSTGDMLCTALCSLVLAFTY